MKPIIYVAMICSTSLFLSCNGGNSNTSSSDSTTTMSSDTTTGADHLNSMSAASTDSDTMNRSATTTGTAVTDKDVTDFVNKATSGGMMEVELGNIAAQNAQDARVKNFGAMMVTDHTAAGNELKSMAASNGITVPSALLPEHQGHINMMKNKTGSAFDKAYMDMMVKDHKKDIDEYKKASTGLKEASYKAFAAKTLPTLQKHLDSAQAIHKGM